MNVRKISLKLPGPSPIHERKTEAVDFNISEFRGYLKKGENTLAVEAGKFEMETVFDMGCILISFELFVNKN